MTAIKKFFAGYTRKDVRDIAIAMIVGAVVAVAAVVIIVWWYTGQGWGL
mgnify:CR=1 FL=1